MAEQGCKYLDGPIHSMAEFFETRIENVEKSTFKCSLQKQEPRQESFQEKESSDF